jgi:DNA-binding helix-hairpin-helix protein with protein kinase domain
MSSAQPKPDVVDSQGRPIPLGSVLGKGGEGTVYEIKQTTATVAKVYHKPLSQDRTDKIRTMAGMRTDALGKLTSWPVDLLTIKGTGQPIGLLMPRIADRKNVHHLYGPKSRLQDFPRADWRFLVRAAANIARAFAVVHDTNCVIGDVNHGSIMVAQDATVSLIDCDSFQVNTSARRFLCEVGIETFTPPELQGISFKGVVRTPNFDNFGLAVMIFHLLFLGRHPFAGRYGGVGDMPIAKAIKECRFPYSANHKAMQMDRPPGIPALSFVGTDVAHLFETAFSQTAITEGRPTSREWVAALQKLEANSKQCANNRGHWHPSHLSTCPWCQLEAQGANLLFPFVIPFVPGGSVPTLDVEAFWRQIQRLENLGTAPPVAMTSASPSPAARQVGRPNPLANPISWMIGLGVFISGTLMLPALFWIFGIIGVVAYNFVLKQFSNAEHVERCRKVLSDAETNFNRADSDWQNRAGGGAFYDAKRKFEELRTELNEIPAKRIRVLNQLTHNQRKLQLDRFLDSFELEDAKIEGIGPGRKRSLESYGIETAEDIVPHRLNGVPGFGPKMVERLMKWRKSIEAKFVFDPAKAIDPRDIARVEQDILTLRTKTEAAAKAAYAEATQVHARILAARQEMRPQMDALQAAVAQARADYELVKG